ncbi:hypothetical protein HRR83_002823 [Exophiala dermatitidis]|nr:hypothetical protein HRR74_003745 [Exophiala dermatitidis]KAJ4521886.1 hypothetical protein HRR73_003085 [Exophiala dermatitidis]KAJ4537609.1 hypothetical protein HRR76_005600 [Exophiala dermatitidis]KAJ4542356.1 hypothetical protein HRR78_007056 [Exophiala dermatitidis]KAJ4551727.1 hypothetical protein HRR77_002958 [Exophiala dermatitidis]
MQFTQFFAVLLFVMAVWASPHPQDGRPSVTRRPYGHGGPTSGFAGNGTTSISSLGTAASTATSTSSSTFSGAITTPTTPLTVVASRSGSPIHFLGMVAAGLRFYLGADTLSYCPDFVEEVGACPPGNETAFTLCNMAVIVPGGQQLYVTPRGEIGYTQAHSSFMPNGSLPCPFTYFKGPGAPLGILGIDAFGATGLMACPTDGAAWQVFANLPNATVPQGNASQCLGFDALALDFPKLYAAWQYT